MRIGAKARAIDWRSVYSGEVVELRKEQLLAGAMHIIQQHYADKQNKMEVVAAIFGKKLGEEFVIQDAYSYRIKAKFSEEGILVYHVVGREWLNNHYWLNELLTGEAVIVDD